MGWVRISDDFYDHPGHVSLELCAWGLWAWSLAWSNRNLTDGVVPKAVALRMDPERYAAKQLVDAGRWHDLGETYEINDYLDFQRSAEQIREGTEAKAHRAALRNNKELVREIRARDGNRCRYCGRRVDWTDRKSAKGGTYDHIIPRGPNTAENVAVACRGCNSRKGARTPDAAGMPLLAPGTASEDILTHAGNPPDISGIEPQPQPSTYVDGAPPKRRRTHPIPDPFEIPPEDQAWAEREFPAVNWDQETRKFVNSAKAHDRRYADWSRAWRNWIQRAAEGFR